MKKLISLFIITSITLLISANTCIAQEVKKRAKAELHVAKTEKNQRDVSKSYQNSDSEQKSKVIMRPIRPKAQIKVQPIQRRIEEK